MWTAHRLPALGQRKHDEALRHQPHTGYGYLWWVGEDGIQFGVPFKDKTFSARGSRGQFMVVNPAHDLVIVHRIDTDEEGQRVKTRYFE